MQLIHKAKSKTSMHREPRDTSERGNNRVALGAAVQTRSCFPREIRLFLSRVSLIADGQAHQA